MHRALELQEILSHIFLSYYPPVLSPDLHKKVVSDLAGFARTCHAFKEPALDVLWRVLIDMSPLARCLPEASRRVSPRNMYSFSRPLTQTEWDTLQSYTRRIRYIHDFNNGLDWESVTTFMDPPTIAPFLPNLRTLHCRYTEKTMSLLHLPLPSLVSLNIIFEDPQLFENSLKLFPNFSPNIKKFTIYVRQREDTVRYLEPNHMRRWQNLRVVSCPQVALDVDTLAHLSDTPALNELAFTLNVTLPASASPLAFSNLHDLTLRHQWLEPISRFLSQTRLPALTSLTAFIGNCPSRHELASFLAGVPTSNALTIERLRLTQSFLRVPLIGASRWEDRSLDFEDLWPCTEFSNLRFIQLNFGCNVGLIESQVLALASAWPKLEILLINADWGWNSQSGITPGGLVRLLQTCRSLRQIALCLDTRGYTEVPPSQAPESLGFTLPPKMFIDVLDSVIEAESVPALSTFFRGIATCSGSKLHLSAWSGVSMIDPPDQQDYTERWTVVRLRVSGSPRRPFAGDSVIQVVEV
ncbi:hypothetical protein OG21DRAFT_1450750 [Imleria badia]|nr:hypothetical protein OG21DRAFT_1450750 [Imleria badia]